MTYFWEIIGAILLCHILLKFIKKLGNDLPILEFMLLICFFQWYLSPLISYNSKTQHFRYYMYVDQAYYFSFVVPALFLFTFALSKIKTLKADELLPRLEACSNLGKPIIVIGLISTVLNSFVPASLGFVFFILSSMKYVGLSILLFSTIKTDLFWIIGVFAILVFHSLAIGMFHELMLWGIFFFMIWSYRKKPSLAIKLSFITIGLFSIMVLQSIKSEYRSNVWNNYAESKLDLALNLINKELDSGIIKNEKEDQSTNDRLNQGWIISAVMLHTPKYVDYAHGQTILAAIFSNLLPRFLSPNKDVVGGQTNFKKYTGLELDEKTSMSINILGEAYANFGVTGAIFFMGLWGVFLKLFWGKLVQLTIDHPILFFFIPLIFLQVVKAEIELAVVLNHLVKTSLAVALFLWFAKNKLKWHI